MVSRPHWSDQNDAELKRLAERGYSFGRLSVAMKRPVAFLSRRVIALGISVKKPQRLPFKERSYGSAALQGPWVRNNSQYRRSTMQDVRESMGVSFLRWGAFGAMQVPKHGYHPSLSWVS
jgi:hypothetical protein